jgi:hypothetical protein
MSKEREFIEENITIQSEETSPEELKFLRYSDISQVAATFGLNYEDLRNESDQLTKFPDYSTGKERKVRVPKCNTDPSAGKTVSGWKGMSLKESGA